MDDFLQRQSAAVSAVAPPPPPPPKLVLECHGWVTLEFGLGHVVRDQAYCIILSFAHLTFRSVLVISSSNCFAINMSTTKRSFDTAFKLKVVKAAEDHSKHYAAKLFNVNRRRVQEWCAQKEKLQSLTQSGRPSDAKRRRLQGGGRKCINEDIDNAVLHWLQERREAGVRVTGKARDREEELQKVWHLLLTGWE